jgi:hypothetical protein
MLVNELYFVNEVMVMKTLIYCLLLLYTFPIVEAHAELLAIRNVYMGMSPNQVITNPEKQCKLKGMIYKYNVCSQDEIIQNVRVKAEYYFENSSLRMLYLQFKMIFLQDIISYISKTYEKSSISQEDDAIRYVLHEGEIILSQKTGVVGMVEMKIISQIALEEMITRAKVHLIP